MRKIVQGVYYYPTKQLLPFGFVLDIDGSLEEKGYL